MNCSGPGTTVESVKHCTDTLTKLLCPNYAVLNVTSTTLINEPWAASTSLLVMPGGADLPYCRELDGSGNEAITKYVRNGGKYLGLCAGAYYGSARVEFEVGNLEMEVSGPRQLQFFPGTARGAVYKGFDYSSPVNAKAAKFQVELENFNIDTDSKDILKSPIYAYAHGGCLFVDPKKYESKGVEVLARYLDSLAVPGSDIPAKDSKDPETNPDATTPAAAVYCPFGRGCAVLTGLHPEFSPELLKRVPSDKDYSAVVDTLQEHNGARIEFMKLILKKMGLNVNTHEIPIPSLSRLCLTSSYPPSLKHLVNSWRENIGFTGPDSNELKGTCDTFRIWDALQHDKYVNSSDSVADKMNSDPLDFDKIVKDIDVYYSGVVDNKTTPLFNHSLYYTSLEQFRNALGSGSSSNSIGNTILYGQVVTSTSTLLFKNFNLLRNLPTGFTAVGTVQVAGRGRANNVWVSPSGVLAFSTLLRLPLHNDLGIPSPMVFVQYLAAIAIVEAIKSYAQHNLGIQDFPVFIKWPNDIYIVNPVSGEESSFSKVSGILVNTTVADSEFVMVIGIGINVDNLAPSKSLNTFIDELNKNVRTPNNQSCYGHFRMEILLAKFMSIWEPMVRDFLYQGFEPFEQEYYKLWLHSDKIVTLEQYGNVKAIIRGISKDYGMLVVEEVDRNNKPIGKTFELQPDGNSFDMLKGLLKKKT